MDDQDVMDLDEALITLRPLFIVAHAMESEPQQLRALKAVLYASGGL